MGGAQRSSMSDDTNKLIDAEIKSLVEGGHRRADVVGDGHRVAGVERLGDDDLLRAHAQLVAVAAFERAYRIEVESRAGGRAAVEVRENIPVMNMRAVAPLGIASRRREKSLGL